MTMFLDRMTVAWSGWMWSMSCQVAILILIVWAIDRVIRRWAWPQVCYALWLLVLLKLVCPPWLASPTSITGKVFPNNSEITQTSLASVSNPRVAESITTQHVAGISQTTPVQHSIPMHEPLLVHPYQTAALLVWLAGVVGLSGVLLYKWRMLQRDFMNADKGSAHPEAIQKLIDEIAAEYGLRRRPTLVFSTRILSPAIFGPLRPMLILPDEFRRRATDPALKYILMHELAHVKRGDLLVHTLCMALQTIYWFNPLIWVAQRRMQVLRELCCDATVAGILKEETPKYRKTLLSIAEKLLGRRADFGLGLLGLVEEPGSLITRLRRLEKQIWRHGRLRAVTISIMLFVMLVCVLPMAKSQMNSDTKPAATAAGGAQKGGRIIHFPKDCAVGLVRVCDQGSTDWQAWFKDGSDLGQARGDVTIPAGKKAFLETNEAANADLSFLDQLRPDDLQVVYIRDENQTDAQTGEHLAKLTGLQELELLGRGITDEYLGALKNMSHLRRLDVISAKITAGGLSNIENLPALEDIDLAYDNIDGAGIAHIKNMHRLRSLSLRGMDVTDEGLKQLRGLTNLEALTLMQDKAVNGSFLSEMSNLKSLKSLSLDQTPINDAGLAHIDALTGLRTVSLWQTHVTDKGLSHLAGLNLEELNMPEGITDDGMIYVGKIHSLRKLDLHTTKVTAKGLDHLTELTELKDLQLPSGITDNNLAILVKYPNLERLNIQQSPVTDAGLEHLRGLKSLKSLSLDTVRVSGDGYKILSELPALENLNVGCGRSLDYPGIPMGDAGAVHLAGLKNIKLLDIGDSNVTDAGLAHLERLVSLESLNLTNDPISDKGLDHIVRLPKLRSLNLFGTAITEAGLEKIESIPALRFLDIQHVKNTLDEKALKHLKQKNPCLRIVASADVSKLKSKSSTADHDTSETVSSPLLGKAAPPIQLKTLDGKAYDSRKDNAEVIIVDFWASWCGPCRHNLPQIQQLDNWVRQSNLPVAIYAVNVGETPAQAKAAWKELGLHLTVLMDTEGSTQRDYEVNAIPTTFVIHHGKVVAIERAQFEDFKKLLESLLKPKPKQAVKN